MFSSLCPILKDVFKLDKLSKARITRARLFGKYSHNLSVHAPVQYRLISGSSIHCEDEERAFCDLKNITYNKTNFHGNNVIDNIVTRKCYRKIAKQKFHGEKSEQLNLSDIETNSELLKKYQSNSFFNYDYIKDHVCEWESHLRRISDFLVFGQVWWRKTEFGIEFFDYDEPPIPIHLNQHPKVHHFRSTNILRVANDLSQHWSDIKNRKICIPIHMISSGNDDDIDFIQTNFLSDKIDLEKHFNVSKQGAINKAKKRKKALEEHVDEHDGEGVEDQDNDLDEVCLSSDETEYPLHENSDELNNEPQKQKITSKQRNNSKKQKNKTTKQNKSKKIKYSEEGLWNSTLNSSIDQERFNPIAVSSPKIQAGPSKRTSSASASSTLGDIILSQGEPVVITSPVAVLSPEIQEPAIKFIHDDEVNFQISDFVDFVKL